MSPSQRREEDSGLSSLLPSLQGIVEALGDGRLPAKVAPLHEFLDNDLCPSLRMVDLRCRALEPTQERGLMATLLTRDLSDMKWYAAHIESSLLALGLQKGTSLSPNRSLVALFVRLLSVVELAAATEAEIYRRTNSSQVSASHSVTTQREEP